MILGILIFVLFVGGLVLVLVGWPSPRRHKPEWPYWAGIAMIAAGWLIKWKWYE